LRLDGIPSQSQRIEELHGLNVQNPRI
jgi:hypothetical protein